MAQIDATHQLVLTHLALVQHIVTSLSTRYPRHVDRNDLWNAGALGLVEASKRYDEATGTPFARYAAIRIRGAIIDSTRSRDWATRALRRDLRAIHSTEEDLRVRGITPDDHAVAHALDMSVGDLRKRRGEEVASTLLFLDRESDEAGPTLRDSVVDHTPGTRPDIALEHRELWGTLMTAVEHLPPTQRMVVTRYDIEGEPMPAIASDMGVTEARVSQIRSEALASMRTYFSTLYEEVDAGNIAAAPGKRARTRYLEEINKASWRSRLDAADPRIAS